MSRQLVHRAKRFLREQEEAGRPSHMTAHEEYQLLRDLAVAYLAARDAVVELKKLQTDLPVAHGGHA